MPYVIVEWDQEHDPSYYSGDVETTDNAEDAMMFETAEDALAFGSKLGDILPPCCHVVDYEAIRYLDTTDDAVLYGEFAREFFDNGHMVEFI